MQFRILGHFEVAGDEGTVCTPRAPKQRSLLAYLCLNNGRCLSVDDLVEFLWRDSAPPTARAALQVYMSQIRRRLRPLGFDPADLTHVHPGYVLRLDRHGFDLTEFTRLSSRRYGPRSTAELEREAEDLRQALALWRGPALADLRTVPALELLGRSLDESWMASYERKLEIQLLLGQERSALSELFQLAFEYPERETVHGYLMLALYRSGRPAEALAKYGELRERLARTLGLEPGDRLRRLHRAMLDREAWLERPVDGILPVSA
ncbi:AfsR/SARP family transcriptional regulator [Streptomyces griseocarneus]|uniref:AfsR/SARP family transcriptional regulator n=1 Tax=Streptomyces griseocarneus TaxID=51201 RepID=UPI00167C66F7|nr:AfsR/SARP family transcriptional regulator [Streptomyces griseocarneus]MBZ6473146.1 AfsR/SARP family transcriptional regulator [Streptomyces griseocarneus]GHG60101.1 hypothetical protein GCM10018779_27120 [Streptomyces griseocarneus]